MLAESPIVLLTAALALFSQALAAPAQNPTQAVGSAGAEIDSPFVESSGNLQARSLPSVFVKPKQATCGKSIPSNFMEADPFRRAVDDVCNSLSSQMMKKKSGKGSITHTFTNGVHKKNSWLQQDKDATAVFAMNLSPRYASDLKAKKVAKATMKSLCHDALTQLGSKEPGCTQELGYYKDGVDILGLGIHDASIPSGHATTTAVTDGVSDLFVNNSKDFFGTIRMTWK